MMPSALKASLIFLFLAANCCVLLSTADATTHPVIEYLDDYCGKTYRVDGDVRFKLTRMSLLRAAYVCSLTLKPGSGNRLVARFRSYSMKPLYVNDKGDCQFESIYLSSPYQSFFGNKGYCKAEKPSQQFDLAYKGNFSYQAWLDGPITPAQLEILISEVVDKNGTGTCPDDYFDCERRNYCVSNDLTCNGYDDCGNNEDEDEACKLSQDVIGAIVSGAATITIVLIIVVIVCVRRCREPSIPYEVQE